MTKMFSMAFSLLFFSALLFPAQALEKGQTLPKELRDLDIKDSFIKSTLQNVGRVSELRGGGRLVVVHREENAAFFAQEENPVFEKDAIYTLRDCRIRVSFQDKNTVILAPESQLEIEEVYASLIKGEKSSRFNMIKGRAIFYALKLFSYPSMKVQVKTPNANIGIRGTQFGLEILDPEEGRTLLLERMLASRNLQFVQMGGNKTGFVTRVYVFEGEVDVTSIVTGKSRILRKYEILEVNNKGLGNVRVDPGGMNRFKEEVTSGMVAISDTDKKSMDRDYQRERLDMQQKMDSAIQQERIHQGVEEKMEQIDRYPQSDGSQTR